MWMLALVTQGSVALEQNRSCAVLNRGDLVFYDTSCPFSAELRIEEGAARTVFLHLPRHALRVRERRLRDLVARRIPSDSGPAALLASFMRELADQSGAITTQTFDRLAWVAADLASVVLSEAAETEEGVPEPTQRTALVHAVKAYVISHLTDPELSPTAIATAHNISVRQLHGLFIHQDLTIGAFIREERLRGCRTDLSDPRLEHQKIGRIAARWGFTDPAVFSRTFRGRYRVSPSDYRASMAQQRVRSDH